MGKKPLPALRDEGINLSQQSDSLLIKLRGVESLAIRSARARLSCDKFQSRKKWWIKRKDIALYMRRHRLKRESVLIRPSCTYPAKFTRLEKEPFI